MTKKAMMTSREMRQRPEMTIAATDRVLDDMVEAASMRLVSRMSHFAGLCDSRAQEVRHLSAARARRRQARQGLASGASTATGGYPMKWRFTSPHSGEQKLAHDRARGQCEALQATGGTCLENGAHCIRPYSGGRAIMVCERHLGSYGVKSPAVVAEQKRRRMAQMPLPFDGKDKS